MSALREPLRNEVDALVTVSDGAVEPLTDARRNYAQPLTADRLLDWHADLFPAGRTGSGRIMIGGWRRDSAGPRQVMVGPPGKQHVCFEAPEAARLDREMAAFLNWFNRPPDIDLVLKAAVAHFWFATIQPFEDGNGRIARAITEMALAHSEDSPLRVYSMAAQIRTERDAYYQVLEQTQKAGMDISGWIEWFLGCLGRAIDGAPAMLAAVLRKARFRDRLDGVALNPRQVLVLERMLEGATGKLTSSKYMDLTGCSQDTAIRDILPLVKGGMLLRSAEGGRSTSYHLAEF